MHSISRTRSSPRTAPRACDPETVAGRRLANRRRRQFVVSGGYAASDFSLPAKMNVATTPDVVIVAAQPDSTAVPIAMLAPEISRYRFAARDTGSIPRRALFQAAAAAISRLLRVASLPAGQPAPEFNKAHSRQ